MHVLLPSLEPAVDRRQYLTKKYLPRYPIPWQVVIVIVAILITSGMGLEEKYELSVIGDIPAGLPPAQFPHFPSGVPGKSPAALFAAAIVPSLLIGLVSHA